VGRGDDQGGVGSEVGQQLGRVLQHALQLAVGPGEEVLDLGLVLGAERAGLRRAQVVHEEAVALVGGDAPGAGVGVGQEALPLELGHVVAHRGGRHLELAHAGDVGRPHRLRGVDVLLDHGPEDGGLAFFQHPETR
jgi:hypothetical protein